MKPEPSVNKTALIEQLRRAYRLDIQSLTYLPTAWSAYCYVVHCANGDRYFLKLDSGREQSAFAASDDDFYLPLTYQLHAKGILPHIPHPIRNQDGELKAQFGQYLLILFNFIEGKTVGYEHSLPDKVVAKLATLVGTLHANTPQIDIKNPARERFEIVFQDALLAGLDVLNHITSRDRYGKRALRDLLLPRQDEILGHLQRLQALRTLAQAKAHHMVVCHTDLHGGNLMLDPQENLYILDWENALLAPPEHDMIFFLGDDRFFDLFLPHYERAFGPARLDSDLIGFFLYRRNLEDLAGWIVRILYENTDDAQDQQDIEEILDDCIAGWPHLERTIEKPKRFKRLLQQNGA